MTEPGPWNPTPDQFDRYIRRETEMAVEKLQKGRLDHTNLHSPETVMRARELAKNR